MYANGLAQAKLAETNADETRNTILVGVSQIIQEMILGEATSLWVDVPYTEALDYNNFPNPSYVANDATWTEVGHSIKARYLTVNSSNLHNLVIGASPRLIATPGDAKRAAYYFNTTELNTNIGGVYAIDAALPIVTFEETLLIEAEAAQRTGGDAAAPFNALRGYVAAM